MEEEIKKDSTLNDEVDYVSVIKSLFSHVEPLTYSDSNVLKDVKVYVPIIRQGVYLENALTKFSTLYPEELSVYNDYFAKFDYDFQLDDKGRITYIPPELDELQRLRARQAEEHEKLINLKTALFDHLNISHESDKLEDKLHVKESDFIDCVNFKQQAYRVEDENYKKLYLKNLDEYLNLIPKDKGFFTKETDSKHIGDVLLDFDKFMHEMLRYHFEIKDGTPNQYDAKAFAGITESEIKAKFISHFSPSIRVDIDPEIHEKNHAAFISKANKQTLDYLSNTCDAKATEVVEEARKKLLDAKTDEEKKVIQINTLLNVREYFLTQRKIYKSHNFFTRRFDKNVRPYRDKYDRLFDSLLSLGMSKKFVQSFLNNKVTKINANGQTYDYNKIYNESKHFNSELNSLHNVYLEHSKQNIEASVINESVDKKFENINTLTREKELNK